MMKLLRFLFRGELPCHAVLKTLLDVRAEAAANREDSCQRMMDALHKDSGINGGAPEPLQLIAQRRGWATSRRA